MPIEAFAEPLLVTTVQGIVLVESDGLAITLTPNAAIETGERLLSIGMLALGIQTINGAREGR